MIRSLQQVLTLSIGITPHCKRSLNLSYNAMSLFLYRNKTTVVNESHHQQSVADFYAGKSVFLTGGTGFLGKVFIEKLLYSCPSLEKVYILIRDKKGETTDQRLRSMLENPIFKRVKSSMPQNFNKIVPIVGDICEPNLGIKPEDEDILKENVSVVFHSAATLKFNEPMKVAMNINYEGTKKIISLCQQIKNLHSFVYISTAFSQVHSPILNETIYPAPADVKDVYRFIEKYGENTKKTQEFIGKYPNTYCFSKALSEAYVANCTDLPATIIRPSLVGPTINEPIAGWLDNWFAITGVVFDIARGLNHYALGDPDNKCDVTPVDHVTNLSIIAAAKYKRGKTVPVYNSTTTGCNPMTWRSCIEAFTRENLNYGFYDSKPSVKYYNSKFLLNMMTTLFQKSPAYTADMLLWLRGKKPRHVKNFKRAVVARDFLAPAMAYSPQFHADKTRSLYKSLSKSDQQEFRCDPADINWDKYFKVYFDGVTEHLLPRLIAKERLSFVPKNFSNSKILIAN